MMRTVFQQLKIMFWIMKAGYKVLELPYDARQADSNSRCGGLLPFVQQSVTVTNWRCRLDEGPVVKIEPAKECFASNSRKGQIVIESNVWKHIQWWLPFVKKDTLQKLQLKGLKLVKIDKPCGIFKVLRVAAMLRYWSHRLHQDFARLESLKKCVFCKLVPEFQVFEASVGGNDV